MRNPSNRDNRALKREFFQRTEWAWRSLKITKDIYQKKKDFGHISNTNNLPENVLVFILGQYWVSMGICVLAGKGRRGARYVLYSYAHNSTKWFIGCNVRKSLDYLKAPRIFFPPLQNNWVLKTYGETLAIF